MDSTPQALWQAKEDAVALRNGYLSLYKERLLKWVGNRFRVDWKTTKQLENYAAGYIAFMLPQMVADHPVAVVTPRTDPRDTATSEGMGAIINNWIDCTAYKRTVIEPCATNMLLGWGVSYKFIDLTTPAAKRGMPIVCKPIPLGDYFCDGECFGYENRRFEGHAFEKTKEQLLADPLYAQQAALIATLVPNGQARDREDVPTDKPNNLAKAEMITLWQFYLREEQQIVTLVQSGSGAAELRRESYFGPEEGPYTLWGCYSVPGQIYPLSPLASVEEQSDDLQAHATAASKSAKTHKKFGVYQKNSTTDGVEVQTVKAGQMIGLTNPESFKDAEIGGMSETQVKVLGLLRDRMDRNLGFTDAQRGMATGKATLGENQLAQNNSDAKTGYIAGRLKDCAERDLRAVAWFFYNSRDVIASMTMDNPQTGQSEPAEFYGGDFQEAEVMALVAQGKVDPSAIYSIGKDWTDYHLAIAVESMQRVADPVRQKRAQDEIALMQGIAQIIAAAYGPQAALVGINWKRLMRRFGQAFNEPKYDQIVFTPAFDQMSGPDPLALGMMGMGGQPMQAGMMGAPQSAPGIAPAQPPQPQAQIQPGSSRGPAQGMASPQGVRQQAMAGAA